MALQDKNKKKTKKKQVTVRFDISVLEMVKKDRGLKTPHEALAFYEELYKQTFHPIAGNPVMERNATAILIDEVGKFPIPGINTGQKPENVPRGTFSKGEILSVTKQEDLPVSVPTVPSAAPAGLKGIDLALWKAEQKEKAEQAKNAGK